MLYYRMQFIVCFLVTLLGLVIAEKGQRGYSPAHNLRNYGTVEGRGLWLGGGWDGLGGRSGVSGFSGQGGFGGMAGYRGLGGLYSGYNELTGINGRYGLNSGFGGFRRGFGGYGKWRGSKVASIGWPLFRNYYGGYGGYGKFGGLNRNFGGLNGNFGGLNGKFAGSIRGFGSYGGYKKGIYDSPRVKW
jgi:hypothetical protein